MSFDLRLRNGDLVLGADGDFEVVRNTDKLIQDILIILNTPLGSDPFNPTIGSLLTAEQIGTVPNEDILQRKAENAIEESIEQLIAIQIAQEAVQYISPEEKIVGIISLSIEQDDLDPRQYNIFLDVASKGEPEIQIPEFKIDLFA